MIKNKTRNTIVSKTFSKKSALGKIKGLLGEKTPQTIVLNTRFGIHTFFLQFPIDIVILDKNNNVTALKKELKPNRVFFWNIRFDTVVELPGGYLRRSKTEIGDVFELTF
jgi:hypothetical protein